MPSNDKVSLVAGILFLIPVVYLILRLISAKIQATYTRHGVSVKSKIATHLTDYGFAYAVGIAFIGLFLYDPHAVLFWAGLTLLILFVKGVWSWA